jgi:hypothetical protein
VTPCFKRRVLGLNILKALQVDIFEVSLSSWATTTSARKVLFPSRIRSRASVVVRLFE